MFGLILLPSLLHWAQAKRWIEEVVPLDNAALHIVVGLIIYMIAAKNLRPNHQWLAWLTVLIAASLNEAADLLTEKWPDESKQYAEAVFDLALTLALPSLLLGASRLKPKGRLRS